MIEINSMIIPKTKTTIVTMLTKVAIYVEVTEERGGVVDLGDALFLHIHNFTLNPIILSHKVLYHIIQKGMKISRGLLKALGIDHQKSILGIDHLRGAI